jgi:hypothetical protein
LSVIDRPTVWYLTDVLIIVGCRIHFWADVLRCCGGKFSILTYEDEGGTEFCATWRCCVQNLISSCLTHLTHRQGKQGNGKEFEFEREINMGALQFCCCEFVWTWGVVSPALQVTLSRVKKKPTAEYRMGNWLATEVFLSQLAIRVPCISTQYWLM